MVVVRYFAGARAAAGTAEEKVDAPTLGALIGALAARGDRLASVLPACSYLVDGLTAHDRSVPLPDGATVDVLPPFAGG
jgi:molybdopterin converting factor small subunit